MNAKNLGFGRKKIHPQGKNSAANLLFNTHIDMYTKDPAQVRISKEGKLQIFDRIWYGLTQVSHNGFFATSAVTSCLFILKFVCGAQELKVLKPKRYSSAESLKHQWCYNERLKLCIVHSCFWQWMPCSCVKQAFVPKSALLFSSNRRKFSIFVKWCV